METIRKFTSQELGEYLVLLNKAEDAHYAFDRDTESIYRKEMSKIADGVDKLEVYIANRIYKIQSIEYDEAKEGVTRRTAMDYYESRKEWINSKKFSTPEEREEYKRIVKEEARTIKSLPLSARNDHYKKAEQEYGKEHALKLAAEVKKQRQRSEEMEM
jgi:hypothetical protein